MAPLVPLRRPMSTRPSPRRTEPRPMASMARCSRPPLLMKGAPYPRLRPSLGLPVTQPRRLRVFRPLPTPKAPQPTWPAIARASTPSLPIQPPHSASGNLSTLLRLMLPPGRAVLPVWAPSPPPPPSSRPSRSRPSLPCPSRPSAPPSAVPTNFQPPRSPTSAPRRPRPPPLRTPCWPPGVAPRTGLTAARRPCASAPSRSASR
ncbi:hypothetical protein DFJ74DRAFT_654678 [Hyaloraphidium curvatum]|nr:hypothetical protein DFJ74DRAFT_654678 [Hyaloraphidium curvatum]